MDFESDIQACHAMLCEVATVLAPSDLDFVIIGGWVPYLLNDGPLQHPGTGDVDILINEATQPSDVVSALDALRYRGYIRASKNKFQLFRQLSVGGEMLAFHVDIIHRSYAGGGKDLIIKWGSYESIAAPGTDIVFSDNERIPVTLTGVLPDATACAVTVDFASEPGFLSTKGRAVDMGKRTRDAYDAFLVVKQSRNKKRLIRRCRELLSNGLFEPAMRRLALQFRSGRALKHAAQHLIENNVVDGDAEVIIRDEMEAFFNALKI